jgi:hypothetical protein
VKVTRTMPAEGWVPVANTTAQSRTLSWRAKGLLLDLLSFPDGYHITFDKLIDLAKRAGDPDVEGRDALRRAMQELERKGYIAHVRSRIPNPAPGGQRWKTETVVCDLPGVVPNPGPTGFQDPQVSGLRETGTSSFPEVINNTEFYKTGEQDEAGQHATALAAARARQQAGANDHDRLARLYNAADRLDDDQLRRLLLAFEVKRKKIYRDCRNAAIRQLDAKDPWLTKGPDGTRNVDLLSYKYALQHYEQAEQLPTWLTRFPRQRRAA